MPHMSSLHLCDVASTRSADEGTRYIVRIDVDQLIGPLLLKNPVTDGGPIRFTSADLERMLGTGK